MRSTQTLFGGKQKDNEPLRAFVKRFTTATLESPEASDHLKCLHSRVEGRGAPYFAYQMRTRKFRWPATMSNKIHKPGRSSEVEERRSVSEDREVARTRQRKEIWRIHGSTNPTTRKRNKKRAAIWHLHSASSPFWTSAATDLGTS